MNKKSIPSLDIDLTPLLDVIFIVLMVVMCHQSLGTQAAEQKIGQLTTALNKAESKNGLLKKQLETFNNADILVAHVTLHADYDLENPKTRHIKFVFNNNVEFEEITITPETEEKSFTALETNMKAFLDNKKDKPVLIALNEDCILYRDQVKLFQMLTELENQYKNLYIIDAELIEQQNFTELEEQQELNQPDK